jgi:DNA modification methylase
MLLAAPAETMRPPEPDDGKYLAIDTIHCGDARDLMPRIRPASVALSVWSPPYFVGKSYERDMTYDQWCDMLRGVIAHHYAALKPGGFMVVNIADILCFPDLGMPRIMAENHGGNRVPVTREDVLQAQRQNPKMNRYQLAALLGVSEQTVDRRLKNNNIRGGKYNAQTRVKLAGCLLEQAALEAGLYLYDRRVWAKDPAWENSRWHTNSYRAVDEFEYLFVFWKPGITKIDRKRLRPREWAEWGSRAIWFIPSVRANDNHEAKFPAELPSRCIRLLTDPGETVLDCFVGSGTSAVAAIELGRHFIGIEKMPKYAKIAQKACAVAVNQPKLKPSHQSSAICAEPAMPLYCAGGKS